MYVYETICKIIYLYCYSSVNVHVHVYMYKYRIVFKVTCGVKHCRHAWVPLSMAVTSLFTYILLCTMMYRLSVHVPDIVMVTPLTRKASCYDLNNIITMVWLHVHVRTYYYNYYVVIIIIHVCTYIGNVYKIGT